MSVARTGDDRGNVLPLAVMSMFVLLAVVAFSVDQGVAYAAKARQENALDSARTACMDAAFMLQAKNSEDPGREIAEQVLRTVRGQGFAGAVKVWFYEAPEGSVPASERLWGIGMQLEEDVATVFAAGFGVRTIPAASHRVMTATPYASTQAWRPDGRICGLYEAEGEGSLDLAFTSMGSLGSFPYEMADAVRASAPIDAGL